MKCLWLSTLLLVSSITMVSGKVHPCLIMTKKGVKQIVNGTPNSTFENVKNKAAAQIKLAIADGIDIPIPKDMAGGYSHEKHKSNYKNMALAGALYQLTKEDQYAEYVKNMLLGYEKIFMDLPPHPSKKSYARGKLFWQCLNDANWLVYSSQAYDAVYNYISAKDQKRINENLFKPYAEYISTGNPKFFNRVHNHSTWANAAVGMVGLVINDDELVERALYGLPKNITDPEAYDNDGGLIYEKGKAGFFAQIDNAFSPDGYYEEGPYYQRYAMTPFMLFAAALDNNRPKLKIFAHSDSVLVKAVFALLNQTNQNGEFFPINDAQKGMSVRSSSVIAAVNICYSIKPSNRLLQIAQIQQNILLNQYGYGVALDLPKVKESASLAQSVMLTDGAKGDNGALMILRSETRNTEYTAVLKATGQGLGHGHYDKLGLLFYAGDNEVIQDYGSARWVNVEQKQGGRYLPENKSWAKQTIAHNTLVVDRKSHYNGKYKKASLQSPIPVLFDVSDKDFQICVAEDTSAYPGIKFQRYVALVSHDIFRSPVVVDVLTAQSADSHTYELPFQYADGYIHSSPGLKSKNELIVMGDKAGFQHLFLESKSPITNSNYSFTWFRNKSFYTITGTASVNDSLSIARIGANDEEYNLRRDALMIHQKPATKNAVYATVIEPHGNYNYDTELGSSYPNIQGINISYETDNYLVINIDTKTKGRLSVCLAKTEMSKTATHNLNDKNGVQFNWTGPYNYKITKQ
jgi:oligo-alginate lyase